MSKSLPDYNQEQSYRTIRINSTLQDAKLPEAEILSDVRRYGYCEEAEFAIKLALEEAMTNAVKHGNGNDASKQITVRFDVDADRAVIIVRDQGRGFDPDKVPDPTANDRLALPEGRGIMLMRAYVDVIEFRDNGCEVYMMKRNKLKVEG
ncbi:MAG: ATP-binding protein [Phycisphaerae bacterium]